MKDFLDEEQCFKFYKLFPLIFSAILTFGFVVVAIISLLQGMISAFFPIIIVGVIAVPLSYLLLKVLFSPMILKIEYLEIIARNTQYLKPEPPVSNASSPTEEAIDKKIAAYKSMCENGIISKDVCDKKVAALMEEKAKLLEGSAQENS